MTSAGKLSLAIPLFLISFLMGVGNLHAAGPDAYWANAEGLTGDELRGAINHIIRDHTVIPYDSTAFDAHDGIDLLDEDPSDPNSVLLLYSDATAPKSTWPGYSREHVWPRSLGTKEGSPAYSDLHHIYACDANINSARGNKPYDTCVDDCEVHVEAPDAPFNSVIFEPPDWHKGDVARALFYVDVRYEGATGEPDLRLTDALATTGCECMGRLQELLEWHHLDPVDDRERNRNEAIYALQGNRNPFIDNPQWACELWASPACGTTPEPPADGEIWINELHYDNAGADTSEGFEIAGPAGMDLGGWEVALYNGNGGGVYGTVLLSGVIPRQQGGYGTLWFARASLQNGPTDGLALVDPEGDVVSFLSYEGTLRANSGPAAGMTATDIGVRETSGTASTQSLQRVGDGWGPSMLWEGPTASTPGRVNDDQTLGEGGEPPPPDGLDVWISELHYDNAGGDVGEGFEISGLAGVDLSGYAVVLYNGNGAKPYADVGLSGVIPSESGGYGAIWFARAPIQNGGRDALALINPDGGVVEFISYEGVIKASTGPAAGVISEDIGVEESSSTAVGLSLSRLGLGFDDDIWVGPDEASPGEVN